MPLKWDVPATRTRKKPVSKVPVPTATTLEGGWTLHEARGFSFGQGDAKSCARAISAALRKSLSHLSDRPWAVLGEVPLEDERSACGCTTVVFAGVRHQMPEKVFGNNWFELRHSDSGLVFCFDCASALLRWGELSLALLDERRSGRPVWSGWTCDAAELREAFDNSFWSSVSTYRRREEWDWCYRTDYAGSVHCGAGAIGACARRAANLQQHVLIRAVKRAPYASGAPFGEASASLSWSPCTCAAAESTTGPEELWAHDEVLTERVTKLYEDHLSELGVSRLEVRFREFEHGWEARVQWWSVLNPARLPKRGVPHARLRETVIRWRYEAAAAVRVATERCLYFTDMNMEQWEGCSVLNPDAMRDTMPLLGPAVAAILRVGDAGSGGDGGASNASPPLSSVGGAQPSHSLPPLPPPGAPPDALPSAPPGATAASAAVARLDGACTSLVPCAKRGRVIAASAGSGTLMMLAAEREVWRASHADVESVAFWEAADTDVALDAGECVLSSGADGCVRAWSVADGAPLGCAPLSGAGADISANATPIVQCVASRGAHAAAACGASVIALLRSAAEGLTAAAPRPALPSIVTDLSISADVSGGARLLAGTMHSGAYLWWGACLDDPSAAAQMHLECASSIQMVGFVGHAGCWARCGDRTVRYWRRVATSDGEVTNEAGRGGGGALAPPTVVPALSDAPARFGEVPMTFGALSAGPRSGPQVESCALPRSGAADDDDAMADAAPESLMLMADGAHGIISWRLAADFMHSEKGEGELELGIDSRRADRLPFHAGQRILCLALSPPCEAVPVPTLACGCDDGTLLVITMDISSIGRGSKVQPPKWLTQQCVRFPSNHGRGAIVQLAWATDGDCLYAGSADGSIHMVHTKLN